MAHDDSSDRRKTWARLTWVVTGVIVSFLVIIGYLLIDKSPTDTWHEFLNSTELAEDQLIDPLILTGQDVVPIVIQNIEHRDCPRRPYAIQFVGHQSRKNALPALEGILFNESKSSVIRGGSLRSILMCDYVGTLLREAQLLFSIRKPGALRDGETVILRLHGYCRVLWRAPVSVGRAMGRPDGD